MNVHDNNPGGSAFWVRSAHWPKSRQSRHNTFVNPESAPWRSGCAHSKAPLAAPEEPASPRGHQLSEKSSRGKRQGRATGLGTQSWSEKTNFLTLCKNSRRLMVWKQITLQRLTQKGQAVYPEVCVRGDQEEWQQPGRSVTVWPLRADTASESPELCALYASSWGWVMTQTPHSLAKAPIPEAREHAPWALPVTTTLMHITAWPWIFHW